MTKNKVSNASIQLTSTDKRVLESIQMRSRTQLNQLRSDVSMEDEAQETIKDLKHKLNLRDLQVDALTN